MDLRLEHKVEHISAAQNITMFQNFHPPDTKKPGLPGFLDCYAACSIAPPRPPHKPQSAHFFSPPPIHLLNPPSKMKYSKGLT
jgi:hypothetical protein